MHLSLVTYNPSIAIRISMYKNRISLRSKSQIYIGLKRNTECKRNKLPKIELQDELFKNGKHEKNRALHLCAHQCAK
ncbi:hypothetical protein Hanom_Chr16g01447971 [Helianthus anomalus]